MDRTRRVLELGIWDGVLGSPTFRELRNARHFDFYETIATGSDELVGLTRRLAIYFDHEGPTDDIPSTCKIEKSAVPHLGTGASERSLDGASGAARPILEAAARQVVPLPIEWTPVGGRLVNEEIMEGVLAEAHILR